MQHILCCLFNFILICTELSEIWLSALSFWRQKIFKLCQCDILLATLYFWCYISSDWVVSVFRWHVDSLVLLSFSHISVSTSPSTSCGVYSPWTVKSRRWLQEFTERDGGGEGQGCPVGWVSNARLHTRFWERRDGSV